MPGRCSAARRVAYAAGMGSFTTSDGFEVRILPTKRDAAIAAADLIEAHIAQRSRSDVALAGGSTPVTTYEALAERNLPWDRVTFWLGDERWVTADNEDSNTGMARRTLGPGGQRVVAPDAGLGDPAEVAASYAIALNSLFAGTPSPGVDGEADDEPSRRPQLVLLGMGDDGHTASLFPGTPALDVMDRDYVANWVDKLSTWRLTATLPLLWAAEHLVFLVTGAGKADVLAEIIDEAVPYPSQCVAAGAERVTWVVDEAAAASLRGVTNLR